MIRREGFWRDSKQSDLPMPLVSDRPWAGKEEFINKLDIVQGRGNTERVGYRGFSMCRVCGKHNGTASYICEGWEWPEGFMHYVEEHNVRPSLAFEEFITQKEVK